jgi:hypothetical protein
MRILLLTTALPVLFYISPALASEDIAQLKQELQHTQVLLKKLEQRLEAVEVENKTMTRKLATVQAPPPAAPQPAIVEKGSKSSDNALNPAISAILMGGVNAYSRNPATAKMAGFAQGEEAGLANRGFSLGESELNFSSNIDNMFYGSLTTALSEQGGDTEIELEEAFIETLALPYGAKAKAGRFFPVLGYLNEIHAHADSFIDRPLPYRAFLGGSNFSDDGVQLSVVLPTRLYSEIGGGAFAGSAFPASDHGHGVSAQTGFARVGGDIGVSHAWRAEVSTLHGQATDRETDDVIFNGDTHLYIADAKYTWAPNGNPANQSLTLQGEYFWRNEDGDYNAIVYDRGSSGWYGQAVYKFQPQWKTGYRFASLDGAGIEPGLEATVLDAQGHNPYAHSLLLEYDNSEFSSIRLQYTRDESDQEANDTAMLWYTVSMGAHKAHQY